MRNTAQTRFRQLTAALAALALVLSVLGPVGMAAAAPSVSVSQSADSTTVNPGDTVTLTTTVSAQDVNGPLLAVNLPDGWEGEVTDADGGAKKPQSGTSNTPEVVWLGGGDYEVTVEVQVPSDATPGDYTIVTDLSGVDPTDDDGGVANEPDEMDSTSTTITVEEEQTNSPPTASISGPTSAEVGEQVTYTASASDDGTIASYEWDFDGDGETDATGESVTTSFDSAGSYDVELTVTDDQGAETTATQTITVSEAPDPANFQISNLDAPSEATQGDTVTVTATVENTGDVEATQPVEFSFDGSVVDSQQVTLAGGASDEVTFTLDTTGVAADTYTHGVSTNDDTATAQITVNEPTPEPPADTIDVSLEPADQTAVTGEEVTYDVVVSGTDDVGSFEGLTVSLTDSATATIVDASTPASDGSEEVTVDGNSATIAAFGLPSDTSDPVTIATITVSADANGETDLTVAEDVDIYVSDQQGTGYTVDSVSGATLTVGLPPVAGDDSPTNMDDDVVLEDVNGDGSYNVGDAQALFANRNSDVVQNNVEHFDFNGDGIVNVGDVQAAFFEAVLSGN